MSFGTNLNSEKLVEVSYGGHGLSWKLAGAGSAVCEVETEAGEPAEQTDEERDMGLRFPAELFGPGQFRDYIYSPKKPHILC